MNINVETLALAKKVVKDTIGEVAGIRTTIVNALPSFGDKNVIYFVKNEDNTYDEYMWGITW